MGCLSLFSRIAGSPSLRWDAAGYREWSAASSMTDGTSDRFEILSPALQLINGATDGPPGLPGSVFPTSDLTSLVDDNAGDLGRHFLRPGIGG